MIFGGGSVGGGAIGTGIVFTLYDQFSATSDKIATKFKTLEGISEQAANKIDSSLSKMKLGFASMVVGAGILATLAFPIDKAAEFEQGLSAIKAVSGATNAEMKILSDLSLEMGKKTKYSALESAQGIEE
ncbi:MAG TPA: phage tail tape measure protein, partial [Bacteroidia bacterium]|nr:phage tail tape measure protein [Bacteroidia bacterium]